MIATIRRPCGIDPLVLVGEVNAVNFFVDFAHRSEAPAR